METHIQRFIKKVSVASITLSTIILLLLIAKTPDTCVPSDAPAKPHLRFPRSTCDSSPRQHLPLHKKNSRLWTSSAWKNQLSSYTAFFLHLHRNGLLHNHSKALCVSAGAGHEVMALTSSPIDLSDVTGVELVESLPLVTRADPHNLPFFDGVFDFVFSSHFAQALFPERLVEEMERTVRHGGVGVVAVDECGEKEVREVIKLFRNSEFVSSDNVTLIGNKMSSIVMRKN